MKFKPTYVKHKEFEEIKRIVPHNSLLDYPDFNKQFKIHTDARNLQLGMIIIQEGKLISL